MKGRPAAMACPATATCCCTASSLRSLTTANSSRPARLIFPSTPCPRTRLRLTAAAASEPPLGVAGEEDAEEARDEGIGFEMEVSKVGTKRNRRVVRAQVRVDAPLEAVWATLTDYEGLADFIPGLSECRLLQQDQAQGFARLYQDLALGFKFNAKGTIDCYEGDMESLPAEGARRREIAFNMIDGDFKLFQGKWSLLQQHEQTTTLLSYVVELEPKLWVPVSLLEGRICREIKNNLVSIRQQAHRISTTTTQNE